MSRRPKDIPRQRPVMRKAFDCTVLASVATPVLGVRTPARWATWPVCLLLALAVWLVFGQTRHHEFINLDDQEYVYENPNITRGLSWEGIEWSLTHFHMDNWHPITTLSHMLDCQLYGLWAGGHHLTNVLIHGANSILLFLVLRFLTSAIWRNAFIAAVFAIHPLRVESVAWVSDRKDLLCGLFFLLTLWAYGLYVRAGRASSCQESQSKPTGAATKSFYTDYFYWTALLFFALGLMSKATLVTLPFVLLLLDYWPLMRITAKDFRSTASRLVLEKIPFLSLSFASCVLAFTAQGRAITKVEDIDLTSRVASAINSYGTYLWQTVYPARLAIPYPRFEIQIAFQDVVLWALVLLIISVMTVRRWRRMLYLPMGWLWYVGMLVPVNGLVYLGIQTRADRYTYLPQIGLLIMLVWGLAENAERRRSSQLMLAGAGMSTLVGLLVLAHVQTGHWRNSETLWKHTLACGWESSLVHDNLGLALYNQGKLDEAIEHFQAALRIKPDQSQFHLDYANAVFSKGNLDEAIEHYQAAIRIDPKYAMAHNNLGNALHRKSLPEDAIEHFQAALLIKPHYAEAYYNWGIVLSDQGKLEEAIEHYKTALRIRPDYAEVHINWGNALSNQGKLDESAEHYQAAIRISPNNAEAHCNLGLTLADQGKADEARVVLENALKLAKAQNNHSIKLTIEGMLSDPSRARSP